MSDDSSTSPPAPPAPPAPVPGATASGGNAPSETGKILAAIGYIFGIVALVAILIEPYKDERFVRHHAMQALAIWVGFILLNVLFIIPIIGWIIGFFGWIALLVLAIMGVIKALQSKMWEMPVVYGIVKSHI